MCFHLQADDGLVRFAVETRLRDAGYTELADEFRDHSLRHILVSTDWDAEKMYGERWKEEVFDDAMLGRSDTRELRQELRDEKLLIRHAKLPGRWSEQHLLFLVRPQAVNDHSSVASSVASALGAVTKHEKLDLVEV